MASLLHQLAHPESRDEAQLLHEQERARQAPSDAEAAAERLSKEPSHPPLTADLARGLIAIGARLAHGVLAAHALVEQREGAGAGTAATARCPDAAGVFVATPSQDEAVNDHNHPRQVCAAAFHGWFMRLIHVHLAVADVTRVTLVLLAASIRSPARSEAWRVKAAELARGGWRQR
jgi:hypothetical protein